MKTLTIKNRTYFTHENHLYYCNIKNKCNEVPLFYTPKYIKIIKELDEKN